VTLLRLCRWTLRAGYPLAALEGIGHRDPPDDRGVVLEQSYVPHPVIGHS